MKLAVACTAAVLLAGCTVGLVAGGAGGGWLASAIVLDKDANLVLVADAPAKRAICDAELPKPHGAVLLAGLTAYCDAIPTSIEGAVATWTGVIGALLVADAEERAK